MAQSIHGIIPAVCLPYNEDGTFNSIEFAHIVQDLLDAGVHGIMVSGGNGEFMTTSREEKQQILKTAVDTVGGRVPIIAGTGAVTTAETIQLTQDAENLGATAISVITPYSLHPSQDEIYEHYREVSISTSLPVFIYNNPGMASGNFVEPATVKRLAAIDNLVGIKDSTGNLSNVACMIQSAEDDFTVLIGTDTLILAGLVYGARGAIAACANLVPEALVAMYEAYQQGNLTLARHLQLETIMPLRTCWGYCTAPQLIREGLAIRGYEMGPARKPLSPMDPEKLKQFAKILNQVRLVSAETQV